MAALKNKPSTNSLKKIDSRTIAENKMFVANSM